MALDHGSVHLRREVVLQRRSVTARSGTENPTRTRLVHPILQRLKHLRKIVFRSGFHYGLHRLFNFPKMLPNLGILLLKFFSGFGKFVFRHVDHAIKLTRMYRRPRRADWPETPETIGTGARVSPTTLLLRFAQIAPYVTEEAHADWA